MTIYELWRELDTGMRTGRIPPETPLLVSAYENGLTGELVAGMVQVRFVADNPDWLGEFYDVERDSHGAAAVHVGAVFSSSVRAAATQNGEVQRAYAIMRTRGAP